MNQRDGEGHELDNELQLLTPAFNYSVTLDQVTECLCIFLLGGHGSNSLCIIQL